MKDIGVAVLGFGLAGRVFHAPFVSAVPGLRLEAIVQRRGEEAALAYPEQTTGVRILRSVEDALADSRIELVVVATPNETHYALAHAALEAGKHLVVDKPFAATSAQAEELASLARDRGLILAPFHNRRWDGDFLTVKQLLSGGILGRLVTFRSHFDRFRPHPRAATWKEAAHPANGMLFDLGPHLVDQALALFGTPSAITASVRQERDGTAIEDAFDIVLEFDRLRANLSATMIAADAAPRFLMHGTEGSYRKYGLDPQEPALVGGAKVPRLGAPEEWLREPEAKWGELTLAPDPVRTPGKLERSLVQTERGDYRDFYVNVRDAVRGTGALAVTADDGRRVIRLLELARESSRERRTLAVDLT